MKNVAHLEFRSQLEDDLMCAQAHDLEFRLYVRESTRFSDRLQELIDAGKITQVPSLGS